MYETALDVPAEVLAQWESNAAARKRETSNKRVRAWRALARRATVVAPAPEPEPEPAPAPAAVPAPVPEEPFDDGGGGEWEEEAPGAADGCWAPGLMDVAGDILSALAHQVGPRGASRLAKTCRYLHVVINEYLRKLLKAREEAAAEEAEKGRAELRATKERNEQALAAERATFPVGAIVFGAPLARGAAVDSDFDLRIIILAPTNSIDDYVLGHTGGHGQHLGEATIAQRGFGTVFHVALAPALQTPWHPPFQCSNRYSAYGWRKEVGALRAGLAARLQPRASPLRLPPVCATVV